MLDSDYPLLEWDWKPHVVKTASPLSQETMWELRKIALEYGKHLVIVYPRYRTLRRGPDVDTLNDYDPELIYSAPSREIVTLSDAVLVEGRHTLKIAKSRGPREFDFDLKFRVSKELMNFLK